MQFNYKETKIKIRDKEYNVCVPDYNFNNLYIKPFSAGYPSFMVYSSNENMNMLAKAFSYYSRCDDTILYIKCNKQLPSVFKYDMPAKDLYVDLVLLSHKMQFNHKHWKEIRLKLKKKKFLSKSCSLTIIKTTSEDYFKYGYRQNKDFLDLHMIYETLFLTGSATVFKTLSESCYDLSKDECPLEYSPHYHSEYMMRANKGESRYEDDLIFYLFDPNWN